MKAVVVDTNVGIVANGRTEQAGPACVIACITRPERIRDREIVVIDDELRILAEYRSHLSLSGQPGAGDFFFKWLWTNQANPAHCEQVRITPREDDVHNFAEFPDDPELGGFDRSDRKFVAVALRSSHGPNIVNATDSDWHHYRQPLEKHGLTIEFLCPELMK